MDNVVSGGVDMNSLGTAFTTIATSLKELDIGAVFSAIANFAPLWLTLLPLGIGLMLLRRVLTGARKGKAKI
ncbi:MAG: hypothetical protein KH328_09710 [Staphylococcus sp.]|nr:hypothetical protein [Staphylococcus sp.]